MAKTKKKIPPIVQLHYKKGELLMKQGDYGLSIYKILKGHVRVFKETRGSEIALATLGPSEILGEMTFLNQLLEARTASARAVDEVDVEVWHPARLTREYEKMTPILHKIISQTLSRLIRMDKIVVQLTEKRQKAEVTAPQEDEGIKERRYHRKEFDRTCIYRPAGASSKVRLGGRITDISLGGVGIDVSAKNMVNFEHSPGDKFEINTALPNGQELVVVGTMRSLRKTKTPGRVVIGMEFGELSGEAQKMVGFFMMS